MRTLFKYILPISAFLFPAFAFADGSTTIQDILCTAGKLIGQATPIIAALSLLAFFWGLAMYLFSLSGSSDAASHMGGGYGIQAAASPQGKKMGRTIMVYGIIVLFVMVSIWGIVGLLQQTFGLSSGGTLTPPRIGNVNYPTITAPACH
jgi:hypothetical protein